MNCLVRPQNLSAFVSRDIMFRTFYDAILTWTLMIVHVFFSEMTLISVLNFCGIS